MSLRPYHPGSPVPEKTALVVRAAFPRGNAYLLLRDRLGPLFDAPASTASTPRAASRPMRPGGWRWSR
jgi:hypothetical protein